MSTAENLTPETGTALTPQNGGMKQISEKGKSLLAEQKSLKEMYGIIAGCEWGTGNSAIKGENFSPATRAAFAKFCVVTRANPQLHVDILGGKPYLNAQYWADLLNSSPYFLGYEQVNVAKSVADGIRKLAEEAEADGKRMEQAGRDELAAAAFQQAAEFRLQARAMDRTRGQFGVPEDAVAAYETIVRRYSQLAPLDRIAAGEIDGTQFIQEVHECNWAGGNSRANDPVGKANPAHTARTRSLRRAAVKSFSAWMENYDREVTKAEEIMEAEWEIVREDRKAAAALLPPPNGPQAVRAGAGEPSAANPVTAQPMPVEDQTAAPPATAAADGDFDRGDTRKRFFATLRDAGVSDRKAWTAQNGLPASTQDWGRPEFDRALEILVGPSREKYLQGCRMAGADPVLFAQDKIGHAADTLRDYQQLIPALNELLDELAAETDDDGQGNLV